MWQLKLKELTVLKDTELVKWDTLESKRSQHNKLLKLVNSSFVLEQDECKWKQTITVIVTNLFKIKTQDNMFYATYYLYTYLLLGKS
jgi:hypothetical protein